MSKLLLVGCIPDPDFPVTYGQVKKVDDYYLEVNGRKFDRTQGTAAMISAALAITTHFREEAPYVLIAGDIGGGEGTRGIYKYLIDNINEIKPDFITMHYCMPIMAVMIKVVEACEACEKKPFLIADAGAMYAAKGAGIAEKFDLFTPDPSEIAFLADPNATHPAYISRHLFDNNAAIIPEQIAAAYKYHSAAKTLVVKGKTDFVAQDGKVLHVIDSPDVPMLEPIGGTGDTITGLVSGLVYVGLEPDVAGVFACRTNRTAGKILNPTPATKARQLVDVFPQVCREYYCGWSGLCYLPDEEANK
jgi:hypothetical protein